MHVADVWQGVEPRADSISRAAQCSSHGSAPPNLNCLEFAKKRNHPVRPTVGVAAAVGASKAHAHERIGTWQDRALASRPPPLIHLSLFPVPLLLLVPLLVLVLLLLLLLFPLLVRVGARVRVRVRLGFRVGLGLGFWFGFAVSISTLLAFLRRLRPEASSLPP